MQVALNGEKEERYKKWEQVWVVLNGEEQEEYYEIEKRQMVLNGEEEEEYHRIRASMGGAKWGHGGRIFQNRCKYRWCSMERKRKNIKLEQVWVALKREEEEDYYRIRASTCGAIWGGRRIL